MNKKYYIAYGSNLNKEQMLKRCPDALVVGVSELKDYELLFKGSKTGAYLTIEKKKGSTVPVGIWEVSNTDELKLDRYEGFPIFYYKKDLRCEIKDVKRHKKAFVYIMHEDRPLGIPSDFYVKTCLDGYKDFGFDPSYIEKAIKKSGGKSNEK